MEEKRSYYAVIPANVRYDKSLPPSAKLIYGEITALCNQSGLCWAENSYFAGLYEVSDRTIQTWINALVNNGYVYRNFVATEDGRTTSRRCLSIVEMSSDFVGVRKNLHRGYEENFIGGMKKISPIIIQDNNTFNKTIVNNSIAPMKSERFKKPTLEEVKAYCQERNNSVAPQAFYDFYESKGWRVGNQSMKDWKACVRTWERRKQPNKPPQSKGWLTGEINYDGDD